MEYKKIAVSVGVWLTLIDVVMSECTLTKEAIISIYEDCNHDYGYRRCQTKTKWVGPVEYSCLNTTWDEVNSLTKTEDVSIDLTITNSSIQLLTLGKHNFENVINLKLTNSGITKITPGFFIDFRNMSDLTLTHNPISEVGDGVFASLRSLQNLDLSHNLIAHVDEHALMGTTDLKNLNLSYNELSTLPVEFFAYGFNLKSIDISHNNLSEFSSSLKKFGKFRHTILYNIDLSHNKINDASDLVPIPVQSLNLGNNDISKINRICNISRLSIRHNKIRVLDNQFVGIDLVFLDLSFNNISLISVDAFANASHLKYLYLEHNSISLLPIGCFRSLHQLVHLDLSFNSIVSIQFGVFSGLSNLKSLNLSNNNLSIDFHTLVSLVSLQDLRLSSTMTERIDVQFILNHFANLTTISMDGIAWRCRDLAKTLHLLQNRNITVSKGSNELTSNILGIACSEIPEEKDFKDELQSYEDQKSNKNVSSLYLYKYFDSEFKNTKFYKFMEGLVQKLPNLTETAINKYKENPEFVNYLSDINNTLNSIRMELTATQIQTHLPNTDHVINDLINHTFSQIHNDLKNLSRLEISGPNYDFTPIHKSIYNILDLIKNCSRDQYNQQKNELELVNDTFSAILAMAKNISVTIRADKKLANPALSSNNTALSDLIELLKIVKPVNSTSNNAAVILCIILLLLILCLLAYNSFRNASGKKKEEIPLM